jgi:hypothetical protein
MPNGCAKAINRAESNKEKVRNVDVVSKIGKGLGIAAAVALMLPVVALMSAVFGYFAGWLFETAFTDTWMAVHNWLHMPTELTGGMFGAFVSAFGGCFGKAVSNAKS